MARSGRSSGSRSSSSGGGLFGAKRTPAPPAPARRAPPPAAPAASHAPAPMQAQVPAQMGGGGGMLSGIGSTIAQGMAFGTGSAIAHRAGKTIHIIFEFIRPRCPHFTMPFFDPLTTVGAVANSFGGSDAPAEQQQQVAPSLMDQQQQATSGPCAYDKEMFFDCLKQNKGDQEACSFLYTQLQSCQRNETTFG